MNNFEDLPVVREFDSIRKYFLEYDHLALNAPTGSGKSVGLPILCLKNNLVKGTILVVQPRRIAARMIAKRVADIIESQVGEEVGYHVRFENKTTNSTKLIYLTDGMLLKKIQADPSLSGIGVIFFDEFHERSLEVDCGLALVRKKCTSSANPIKTIVMSATLDLEKVQSYMPNCGCLSIRSRIFPVETEYKQRNLKEPVWEQVVRELRRVISVNDGNILIFMDGVFEIRRTIQSILRNPFFNSFEISPLMGEMSLDDQNGAIMPSDRRKIVVSTNIAETSLTIHGIKIVIDTGTAKKMHFDQSRGINVLLSQPICKSSAEQRQGRAGRTAPGYCLRLWTESENDRKSDFERPEISRLDLTGIYLQILSTGENPDNLTWFDEPPKESMERARSILLKIGAVLPSGGISPKGMELAKIPLHPKSANILFEANKLECLSSLALILALLEDRTPIKRENLLDFADEQNPESEVHALIKAFLRAFELGFRKESCQEIGIHGLRFKEGLANAQKLCQLIGGKFAVSGLSGESLSNLSDILCQFYGNNLSRLKSLGTLTYVTRHGQKVHLPKKSLIRSSKWVLPLAFLERSVSGRIETCMEWALPLRPEAVERIWGHAIKEIEEVSLNLQSRKVVRKKQKKLDTITFDLKESFDITKEERSRAYADAVIAGDLSLKFWDKSVDAYLARVNFLATSFPHFGIDSLDDPQRQKIILNICSRSDNWKGIKNQEVLSTIVESFEPEHRIMIDRLTPEKLDLQNGKRPYVLKYEGKRVLLKALLQDLYEVKKHPTIVDGQLRVTLEVLAPNGRPVQVTDNICEFWQNSYTGIKNELKGRYPKHRWQ